MLLNAGQERTLEIIENPVSLLGLFHPAEILTVDNHFPAVGLQQSREQRQENRLQIEVRDDGKGFPAAVVQKNAQPLDENLHSTFGLSTIRHQISLYGGSMEIHSTPDAGARIILILSTVEARA